MSTDIGEIVDDYTRAHPDAEFWYYDTWHKELDPAILGILAGIIERRQGGTWTFLASGPHRGTTQEGWTCHAFVRKDNT